MREYQVSYRGNRLVTKDNIIDVLNELGYRPGGEEGGLRLLTITSWYLKTDQSSGITVQHPENPTLDNPAPPKPGWHLGLILPDSTYRYVWKFSDYHYGDPDHEEIEGFHVYTDCELVSIYSSPDTSMGIDFIYTLFDDAVQSVTLLDGTGDYPVTTETPLVPWTRELDTLPYGQKKYLWMSQRRIEDGDHTNWCIPIRLSGEDGSPGADGRNIEFIYKPKMNRLPDLETYPSDQPYSAGTHDQEIPNGWYNHPSGVGYFTETENGEEIEVFYRYEWASYRLRINDPPDSIKWNAWSPPIVWSAYGEKGMDGDGVEYVYKREWSGKPEEVDHPSEDFIPTTDNPTPDAPSGPVFIYGEDPSIGQEGVEQSWNKGVYLIVNSDPTNPNNWRPEGWDGGFNRWKTEVGTYDKQGEWIPKGWKDEPQGVDEDHKKEYVSSRKRVNEVWGPFSPPKVWATFSKEHTIWIDPDTGLWWIDNQETPYKAEGENGKGIDLKGKVDFYDTAHESNYISEHPGFTPEAGHATTYLENVDDETSEDFRNPQVGDCYVVIYNGHIYLYVGGDEEDWKKHWVDFGEFQGEGAYVHIAWALYIGYNDQGELVSSGFELDRTLSGNTVDYPWMGICTDNNEEDPDARIDPDNLTKYKWNYVHGRDGDNIERVFIRTAVEVAPKLEYEEDIHGVRTYPEYPTSEGIKTYQSQEYLPFVANPVDNNTVSPPVVGCQPDGDSYVDSLGKFQFSDDPMGGVTADLPYLWISERKKRDGEWKYFSVPSLHATYSHNGQSVIRSTIFRRWDSLVDRPDAPGPDFGSYSFPAGYPPDPYWTDGIPPGTGAIWKSERVFTSDTRPPQWDNWSTPTLVQDDDNYDVELSIQARNTTPVPPIKYDEATAEHPCNSHNPEEQSGYDHSEDTPPGPKQLWFDPVLDANYITENNKKFNWMATRTKYVNSSNLPAWRPWTIILIKGEDGATGPEGAGFQHAYIVIDGDAIPNIVPNPEDDQTITTDDFVTNANGTSGYWTLNTTSGLSVGPNQYLWMSERSVSVNGYGPWGDPVKLSGNGTPGEDAEDIEFIYKRADHLPDNSSSSEDRPSEENGKDGKTYDQDDFVPVGWEDNPQGVGYFIEKDENDQDIEVFYKYEWMCQRIKPRTGDIVDPDNPWGHWSHIFVWSAYGDTGMDGDGIEYVYTRISNPTKPKRPRIVITDGDTNYANGVNWDKGVENTGNSQNPVWRPKDYTGNFYGWIGGEYNSQGEWIPEGWTDDPQGVGTFPNPEYPDTPGSEAEIIYYREYVSQRKRVNGVWGDFSDPAAWSIKPQRFHIEDGEWVDEEGHHYGSAEGEDGRGIQLKGTVDVIRDSEKLEYSQDHEIPLANITSLQEINPKLNSTLYGNIQPGDCYVVRADRHLYVCLHDKTNWASEGDEGESWEPTLSESNPDPDWEDVGEFQGQGSYMHIAWAASVDTDSPYGSENIEFENGEISLIKYFIIDFRDKNPNIDYDWMGVRTDNDERDPSNNYDPATYDEEEEIGTNWKLYKWNNVRGRDGDSYERAYLRTKTKTTTIEFESNYINQSNYQESEYLPKVNNYNPANPQHSGTVNNGICTFSDDPVSVEENWPYEWMIERRKKLNSSTNKVEWGRFSDPSLWAVYSFDGKPGKSTQIKYYSFTKDIIPELDNSTKTSPNPTSGNGSQVWQSNTAGLNYGPEYFLWMIQRVCENPETDTTTAWCNPIRISGEDGDPGADGTDIEFIYKRNSIKPTSSDKPSNPTARKKNDHDVTKPWFGDVILKSNHNTPIQSDDWIPVDWDDSAEWSLWEWDPTRGSYNSQGDWIPVGDWLDSPKGVGEDPVTGTFYKYEWMTQRVKNVATGKWESWINPVVWSAYGDTGMDGDGVEYVFYRYQGENTLYQPYGPRALTSTSPSVGIPWDGGVVLKSNHNTPIQSDDWEPKDWDSSDGNGDFIGWNLNYGKYGTQGEWIPRAYEKVVDEDNQVSYVEIESPIFWSDDPLGVGYENETLYLYEYVSSRRRVNGKWGEFSDPKIWASWGTDIHIDNGMWIINGQPSGKAEGEDGTGVSIKGSVDFLSNKDKATYISDYKIEHGITSDNDPEIVELQTKLKTLQEKNRINGYEINIGDCYVVTQDRHLYVSIHTTEFENSDQHPTGWDSSQDTQADWSFHNNWEDLGEFQGKGSYMHIAWATESAVKFEDENDPGKITLVKPFICKYEELHSDVVYDWMGIYTDNERLDPVDNCDANGNVIDGEGNIVEDGVANWSLYSWNHVKGRDGSDHERVYIRTNKYDVNNKPSIRDDYDDDPTSSYQQPEYRPYVLNQTESGASTSRFTDDPIGVSPTLPYEWMSERRKTLDTYTQRMLWGRFSPPALWSKYSFDGLSAQITSDGGSISIDAAGNPIGGIGDATTGWRFHTEVKIWDPNVSTNNTLTYVGSGSFSSGKYKLDITNVVNCTEEHSTGVINITSIDYTKTAASLHIKATAYGGKYFEYDYNIKIDHIPQTYLTYSLTNDSDVFTYRTRTGKFGGLPINTCLEALNTDGTSDKLNDNTTASNGYINKVTVKGIANALGNDILHYILLPNAASVSTGRTITCTSSVNETTGVVTHNTITAKIYKGEEYINSNDTGLRLDVKSNGEIKLYRKDTDSPDIDLADAEHDLEISCEAILGNVSYTSPTKVFKLSEQNDITKYNIISSTTAIIKNSNGTYTPSRNNFWVKVLIDDGEGSHEITPSTASGSVGKVAENVFVRYINPGINNNTTLLTSVPQFDNVVGLFYVVVVEDPGGSNQKFHDRQSITIQPPGPGQTYINLNTDKFIINCDKDGNILRSSSRVLDFYAYLKWGDEICSDELTYTITTNISNSSAYTTSGIGFDSTDTSKLKGRYTFITGQVLYSGTIVIQMEGKFSDGVTRNATGTITIEAIWQGGPGEKGDFKSTAFIRTETDISNYIPIGGDYSNPIPTDFTNQSGDIIDRPGESWGWEDGIPEGKKKLWASTCTFYGEGGNSGWSGPREMLDTAEYDVEFAYQQPNGDPPDEPEDGNRHKDSDPYGYDGQVWFDPQRDKHKGNATTDRDFNNMYWRAERERFNEGTWSPWVITQIKGESEPSVKSDPRSFMVTANPEGKIFTSKDLTFTTRLYSGNQIQTPNLSKINRIEYTGFDGLSSILQNATQAMINSDGDSKSITWTISVPANITLRDTSIKVTMSNDYCTASTNVNVEIHNQSQSQVKSYLFTRSSRTPSKPDQNIGSFLEPGPLPGSSTFEWGVWSDGIPVGTGNVYTTNRIFTSDGLSPQDASWANVTQMNFVDTTDKRIRFSLADANPRNPNINPNYWYNLGSTYNLPTGKTVEDLRWMATGIKSGSTWNYTVVKIKGETGDPSKRAIVSIWYKTFDTLDVTIPDISLAIEDLINAGWSEIFTEPTEDKPYLWEFTRTAYNDPDEITHSRLDLVLVWAENMINPNLLDDTDFINDNQMNAWNLKGHLSGVSQQNFDQYCETLSSGCTSHFSNLLYKQFYVYHKATTQGSGQGLIYFLTQTLWQSSSDGIKKIEPDTWYTLSFLIYGDKGINELTGNTILGTGDDVRIVTSLQYLSKDGETIYITRINTYNNNVIETTSTNNRYIQTNLTINAFQKIIVTFKTPSSSELGNISNGARIEFQMYTKSHLQRVWMSQPKLELGKIATRYVSGSAIEDPFPRMTVWKTGEQYYQGRLGEPYLDIVTYESRWFRCRRSHVSSNSKVPVANTANDWWEPAENFNFIVTDLLLAETGYIKNLVVGGLMTGDRGTPHVEMQGSSINFFGRKEFANIRMSVDSEGMAFLSFYDDTNTFLYDLGPSGLRWKVVVTNASFTTRDLIKMSGSNVDFQSTNSPITPLYKFIPKKEDGAIVGDSDYTNGDKTIAESANGKYFTSQNFLMDDGNGGKKIDPSKFASGTFREQNEPVENISGTFVKTDQDKEEFLNDLVTFYSFPPDCTDEIDLTLNDSGIGLKTPIMLQHGMTFSSGSDRAIVGFKQGVKTWLSVF